MKSSLPLIRPLELNVISGHVVDAGMQVHSALGPGLLESVYVACLTHELRSRGLTVGTQVPVSVYYKGAIVETGFYIDLLVERAVVVEVKAVKRLHPVHEAQLLSYLTLSHKRVGLLLNFHVTHLRKGVKRMMSRY